MNASDCRISLLESLNPSLYEPVRSPVPTLDAEFLTAQTISAQTSEGFRVIFVFLSLSDFVQTKR